MNNQVSRPRVRNILGGFPHLDKIFPAIGKNLIFTGAKLVNYLIYLLLYGVTAPLLQHFPFPRPRLEVPFLPGYVC